MRLLRGDTYQGREGERSFFYTGKWEKREHKRGRQNKTLYQRGRPKGEGTSAKRERTFLITKRKGGSSDKIATNGKMVV